MSPDPPLPDDVQCMNRLKAGDDLALNDIMTRWQTPLVSFILRYTGNQEDARDLAQETFVRVYESRDRYQPGAKFSTWLYTIATNQVKDRYRWRSRHPQMSLDAENEQTGNSLGEHLPAHDPTPSDCLQADERAEAVRCAVAALPEELRQPLLLAEYEQRSHAKIGTILGCTAKAVETRIYRARQQIRVSLGTLLETV